MENKDAVINQLRNSSFEDMNFDHPSGENSLSMSVVSEEEEVMALTGPTTTYWVTETIASTIVAT